MVPVVQQTSMARFAQRQTVGCRTKVISLTPQLQRGDCMTIRTRSRFNGLATLANR
jgi:hypothetical protein